HHTSFRPLSFAVSHISGALRMWSHQSMYSLFEFFRRFAPAALLVPVVAVFWFRLQGHPDPRSLGLWASIRLHWLQIVPCGSSSRLGSVSGPRYENPLDSAFFRISWMSTGRFFRFSRA